MDDERDYMHGLYVMRAFDVVMSHFGAGLSGKKSKAKYYDKPLLSDFEKKDRELTEDEIQVKRNAFVANLMAMKKEFDMNHKGGKGS